MRTMTKQQDVHEEAHVQEDVPLFRKRSYQTVGNVGSRIPGNTQRMRTMTKQPDVHEESYVQEDAPIFPKQSFQTVGRSRLPGNNQRMRMMTKQPVVHEEAHVQEDIPTLPMQSSQTNGSSRVPENTQRLQTITKQSIVHEEDHVEEDIPVSPGYQFMSTTQMGANVGSRFSDSTQILRTITKQSLAHDKENMQANIPFSPTIDHVMKPSQTVGNSKIHQKVRRGRGSNKCKEVASLGVGEKLKVTFYNNRTVGRNGKLFSRHLGKIVRDPNMCPLAVSSWDDIKEEKLNHMWAAVKDKFESDDMDIHRDHIFSWMKELWNKHRGFLHGQYVKGRPVQEALKNHPKGIEKGQWEWLLKKHFFTEKFQEMSRRNERNRAKLTMLPRTGSKPIREFIYEKGGKDGNPPNFATIFYETRKMNDALADFKTIEKHAQIQELMQSEPSLPAIEIVERCFGPQTRNHVFGFGGGIKANDLKGGTCSKAKLWSELCSTREENKSLKDRLSSLENEMKEMKQIKEWVLTQQANHPPTPTSKRTTSECFGD